MNSKIEKVEKVKTRRARTKKDWLTPLSIEARKIGEYEIQHRIIKAREGIMLNNARNFLFGGQKGLSRITYDRDTTWHALVGPEGTWMTDLPVEQRQMEECIRGMRGRVLVGGLGLGLVVHMLAKRKAVSSITVVEKSPEVIDLVEESLGQNEEVRDKTVVVRRDLFDHLKWLKGTQHQYHYAFYDIWQSDGEYTFFNVVCPLIELSKGKIKHPPVCWNENVMRGQLFVSLQNRLLFQRPEYQEQFKDQWKGVPPPWEEWKREIEHYDPIYHNWSVPFFSWWHKEKPVESLALERAKIYSTIYGSWGWREIWGSLL